MNPIALSLELLLAGLLIATLVVGFRLEAKLRALRESQAGFMQSMRDLDDAASRAESGLETLRRAAGETQDEILPRIKAANAAALRLEQLTSDAELAAKRAEEAARSVEASAQTLARAVNQGRPATPPSAPLALAPAPSLASIPEPASPAPDMDIPSVSKLRAPDFAAMLAARTTRQPLPGTPEPEAKGGSRLRQAAALLRGGS